MSDALAISLVSGIVAIINTIITLLINRNVKEYHKQVNGHMSTLLQLKKAEGKEEARIEQVKIDKNK